MEKRLLHLILVLMSVIGATAQTQIKGKVCDEYEPLPGVNVYIVGTIDGGMTDTDGMFSFTTDEVGEVTLCASFLGYDEYKVTADASELAYVEITLREKPLSIDEVCISASSFRIGKLDQFKSLDALDVVMSANSCGDIVAALQMLPGTQKVSENGKLYVRGGESNECQTFINGMHVLVPYSTNVEGQTNRGRFSPFLFKGMSFSLGGYSGEYGQALSSVLPMETTDAATADKLGVSASLVDWNLGGTKAFDRSSLSFNADYTGLELYNKMFPDRADWTRPYGKLSGEAQYKAEISSWGTLKSYAGYDLTNVGMNTGGRNLFMKEHNAMANVTLNTALKSGYTVFTGVAGSWVMNDVDGALVPGDRYHNVRGEIHLKGGVRRSFTSAVKLSAGMEDYIRSSVKRYNNDGYDLHYNTAAAYLDAQVRLFPRVFLTASLRDEQVSYSGEWMLMPRITLSCFPGDCFQASVMLGRYSQCAEDDYIARGGKDLRQSTADHAIMSFQYSDGQRLLKVEPYWKRYHSLPLLEGGVYTSHGYGNSSGLDIFAEDCSLLSNLTLSASYSYNNSERLYLDYDAPRTPEYASRHNLRMSVKYAFGKFVVGMAESYASGRHYKAGQTPFYSSVDANVTYLAHPKVIIYGSVNNITGRKNVYRIDPDGSQVTSSRDSFIYFGIFISLKNNKAYDISNF